MLDFLIYVLTDNQVILISDIKYIFVCVYIYVVYIVMPYVVYIENWKISTCVYKNMYVHNM